ncbi:MAG: cation-translocating P-type ATPase [Proteobacteria bacterium]|nr:cation-translocating P-type ATPase [Pseudomonadota bacterium]
MLGLSEASAAARLDAEGPNELPGPRAQGVWALLGELLREPMVALLIGCGAIYLVLGDAQEALMLLGFLALIIAITLTQARKTETALEALRTLSSPRALVLRDGAKRRIAGREVVREDLLLVAEGDRVAADARVMVARHLLVDESLLTGESQAVAKQVGDVLYAGTTVVRGQGSAEVFATALATELGRIGKVLDTAVDDSTRLQRETRRLVKVLAIGAGALCVLVTVVFGVMRHDWLGGVLTGLTLAMAILPNELPAVLMIFLALGAWRISLRRVLTRRMPAVENLGAATVLCVDKTGTLTMNQMAVRRLMTADGEELELGGAAVELPEAFHALLEFGILASSPAPFDPMERAVHRVGDELLAATEHLHPAWQLAGEHPLTPDMLAVSQAWRDEGEEGYVIGSKGAPEAILDLCHSDAETSARVALDVERFARHGLRVLGVARARHAAHVLPGTQHDYDFEFLGLLGLSDPLRPQVPEAVRECRAAGIRVIMLTGDHVETARSIAREAGIARAEDVVSGAELESWDEATLAARLDEVNCYARMKPELKLRLVQALQRRGEVVAMTGDGVNDAPALKTAEIGIAMGGRGTDVAREAASLVVLDDDFSSIVAAIAAGRRVFSNLRGAMAYLLAVHVPIAGISVLPVLMNLPLVLLPVHVALLHLVIEPACSVVFEAEPAADDLMRRPPRGVDAPLFSRELIVASLVQGLLVLVMLLALYLVTLARKLDNNKARAMTFTALMLANLGMIAHAPWRRRSLREAFSATNAARWWVVAAGLALTLAALGVPLVRELFRFAPLNAADLALCAGAAAVTIAGQALLARAASGAAGGAPA